MVEETGVLGENTFSGYLECPIYTGLTIISVSTFKTVILDIP
jgi:hypothetical protein